MQLPSGGFAALLHTLQLSQGLYKPTPPAGPTSYTKTLAGTNSYSSYGGPSGDDAASQTSDDPDGSCVGVPYDAPVADQAFAPFDAAKATVYRYRQQQSVNLGSWFVHEAWMTPSLFTCAAGDQVSEVDIAHSWGSTSGARSVLERHWDTFINESDFQYLARIGINTVRLPIGYWNLGPDFVQNTPYADVGDVYQNSWPRIMRTINTAAANGIGVLVDLHGAPGSQNGQQHSGISDGQADLFDSPAFINQTMAVLTYLMRELAYVTNVVGIQILNEPENVPSLTDFYDQAIAAMREVYPQANMPLYLHDGFDLDRFTDYVANRKDFVVQDHHSYFVFTPSDSSEPASQHTSDIRNGIADSLRQASLAERRNLVVDEFSCALTDDSLENEPDPDQARMDFCTGQIEMYANTTAGWSFWAYRKEDCMEDPGWCFGAAVGKSLPSTFFSYGAPPVTPEPTQLPDMSTLSEGMTPPSDEQDPSAGNRPPQYDSYSQDDSSAPPAFQDPPGYPQGAPNDNGPSSASQQASKIRGYKDGFLTARIFALYNLSRLGFIGQYITDSLAALGPGIISPGTESFYEEGFMRGLADGEAVVSAGLGASGQR